jgi:hypothetical protein
MKNPLFFVLFSLPVSGVGHHLLMYIGEFQKYLGSSLATMIKSVKRKHVTLSIVKIHEWTTFGYPLKATMINVGHGRML